MVNICSIWIKLLLFETLHYDYARSPNDIKDDLTKNENDIRFSCEFDQQMLKQRKIISIFGTFSIHSKHRYLQNLMYTPSLFQQ